MLSFHSDWVEREPKLADMLDWNHIRTGSGAWLWPHTSGSCYDSWNIEQDLSRKCSAWKDFWLSFQFFPLPNLNIVCGVGSRGGQFLRFRLVYIPNICLLLSQEPFKTFLCWVSGGVFSLTQGKLNNFCPALTKLALDLHVKKSLSICLFVRLSFRSFF